MASPGIKILAFLVALCFAFVGETQDFASLHFGQLQEGDLLFCCADSANAITAVTSGVEDLPIDHVAVFHRIGGEGGVPYVIEAVKPAVCLTPIGSFLNDNAHIIVGRVNVEVDWKKSIRRCLMMVGRPYDDLYLPGDSAIYCSELVQMNYLTPSGKQVFDAIPMSFHDETGQVTDYWREFYGHRGMSVPEGAPGTNPGELSCRPQVTILGRIIPPSLQ